MKKAVAKGFIKIGLLAAMTIMVAGASANAQALQNRITANIPFGFTVANTKLPAGKYWIRRGQSSNGDLLMQISSTDGHSNIYRLTIPVTRFNPNSEGTLVFHRYGDDYFLFQVWPAGENTGRALPQSRTERELARKAEDNGIAALKTPDVVIIATDQH